MKSIPHLLLQALVVCVAVISPVTVLADDWRPVNPAELALKTPVVDKAADAEAIFWEVRLSDEIDGGTPTTVLRHYVRIKVFNERGRETQSKIDIQFLQ